MPLRLCSILGTLLLALTMAAPAFAEKKQESGASEGEASAKRTKKKKRAKAKKSADDEAAADAAIAQADKDEASAPESKSDSAATKQGKKKKKGKKGKAKQEEEEAESDTAATATESAVTAEPAPEPDTWEKPPEEQEKPPASATPKVAAKPKGDGKPISVGLIVGWAFETDRRTSGFSADPYGLGGGVRGGYSVPDVNVYFGLYFMYYLGSAVTGESQYVNNATLTTNANYMQFGAEVGYDWWISSIVIRPSVQLGAALVFTDVPNVQSPISDFMFAPGITVVHPWDQWFLGGDLRANVVTGDGSSSMLLAVTGGMRF
jgi:hypothetical protein